jgi:hypothetical protein
MKEMHESRYLVRNIFKKSEFGRSRARGTERDQRVKKGSAALLLLFLLLEKQGNTKGVVSFQDRVGFWSNRNVGSVKPKNNLGLNCLMIRSVIYQNKPDPHPYHTYASGFADRTEICCFFLSEKHGPGILLSKPLI